jgi:hypothetical protein
VTTLVSPNGEAGVAANLTNARKAQQSFGLHVTVSTTVTVTARIAVTVATSRVVTVCVSRTV